MSRILVFAGTTEGRKVAEKISLAGVKGLVCVATDYGTQVMPEMDGIEVRSGRMTESQMEELMASEEFYCVVDATHPYATVVSENIKAACQASMLEYIRLKRDTSVNSDFSKPGVHYFDDNETCAKALEGTRGNILLTTGSKDLSVYMQRGSLKERLIARVLPGSESIEACEEQGLSGRDIIAMQGPFSKDMNLAQIRDYKINVLVTKMSGAAGGFFEKALAADEAKINLFVIGDPDSSDGFSYEDVCARLSTITGVRIGRDRQFEVCVIGCGMGTDNTLTYEARTAIEDAEYAFGSKRLVENYGKANQSFPFYKPTDIIQYLDRLSSSLAKDTIKAVVLYSGDSGFYSGAKELIPALDEWRAEQKGRGTTVYIKQIPGVTSISVLSSLMGINYENANIMSMHGVEQNYQSDMDVVSSARRNERTFLLLSKSADLVYYAQLLERSGLGHLKMVLGVNMGDVEGRTYGFIAENAAKINPENLQEGLATLYIDNEEPLITRGFTMSDEEFERQEGIPITKEEYRYVVLGKLGLKRGEIFYDIGSGTGSITVSAAGISDEIHVFAIDAKNEAASLTKRNCIKYGRDNVTVVNGKAPEVFDTLPRPDAAFIGGSDGRMREIIRGLRDKNRDVRIVATAITMETVNEILQITSEIPYAEVNIIQMQISKTETVEKYHLIKAQNPAFIACMNFKGKI